MEEGGTKHALPKACNLKVQPRACYLDTMISPQLLYLPTQAKQCRYTKARKCKAAETEVCAWTQGPLFNRSDVLHTNSVLLPFTMGTQWVSTSLGKAKPVGHHIWICPRMHKAVPPKAPLTLCMSTQCF